MNYTKSIRTLVLIIETNCHDEPLNPKIVKTLREYADALNWTASAVHSSPPLNKDGKRLGSEAMEEWEDSQGSIVRAMIGEGVKYEHATT